MIGSLYHSGMKNRAHGVWISLCLSLAVLVNCVAADDAAVGKKKPGKSPAVSSSSLRVMSYNIHHGEGMDKKVDLERIAGLIKSERADIVALQEVDKGTERTQKRDFPAELAKLTGMSCIFSNNHAFGGGEYGNAILSRFPILEWTNLHYKMDRKDEQRGALQAVLDLNGRQVVFINTHIDFRKDDSERIKNAAEIKALVEKRYSGKPVILCGDFNDVPESRTHAAFAEVFDDTWLLAGKGDGFTIPSTKPNKRIDFIWISKGAPFKPVSIWVPDTTASDHRPVVAELRITE
jgi:endonuclease/exonuclease/phosphatase family metal-dependent hydrolase